MDIFPSSKKLAENLLAIIRLPLTDDTTRVRLSDVACSLSIEHYHATSTLLEGDFLSSAMTIHRAQFESLLRSIWLLFCANDNDIEKLSAELNLDTEQAAKNMPQVAQMMAAIEKKAPKNVYDTLARFKEHNWKAMNSYTHAGIHPINRHMKGYPSLLIENVMKNVNGLFVVACMQAVVLSGMQSLQKQILREALSIPHCMPDLL